LKDMEGILLVDKPQGLTSHDVVQLARRKLDIRKIGHSGTLDPMATGLLILLVGRATKLASRFLRLSKEYRATIRLGIRTDTADTWGKLICERSCKDIDESRIIGAFQRFKGRVTQIPPMYSALKYKGQRLYSLARKGIEVRRRPREVSIYNLEIIKFDLPFVTFVISCSAGTYIRSLCDDIGELLGCGACLQGLRRLKIGQFSIEDAIKPKEISPEAIRSVRLNGLST
jgi:tRNA pseudouridine55 synthase